MLLKGLRSKRFAGGEIAMIHGGGRRGGDEQTREVEDTKASEGREAV
jgi:hypothetical protein